MPYEEIEGYPRFIGRSGGSGFIDLTGKRFGMLNVLYRTTPRKTNGGSSIPRWVCKCDCGNITVVDGVSLRNGHTKSCGCGKNKKGSEHPNYKHGLSHTRLHNDWWGMMERCYNPEHIEYPRYGNLGIKVCEDWHTFILFAFWAWAHGYKDDLSIDRIDNSKGYFPENCRYVDAKTQANNRRNTMYLTREDTGETHTLGEWSTITSLLPQTIHGRIYRGWSVSKALDTPVGA